MDSYFDVVVVGSGAAGLTASAIAASEGLKTLLVEKRATIGGTTMLSGGTVWIPNNHIAKQHGIYDTEDKAHKYLEAVLDSDQSEHITATAKNRKEYIKKASQMILYLNNRGMRWKLSKFPDYQPRLEGALPAGGRTVNPEIFDARALESWITLLDLSLSSNIPYFETFPDATRRRAPVTQSNQENLYTDPTRGTENLKLSMGCSLIAQLLLICKTSNRVTIWMETAFSDLLLEENAVVGVELQRGGKKFRVQSKATLLAVAGFARNQNMREKYLQKPTNVNWTLSQLNGDDGHVLEAMRSRGAKTSLLQEKWGIPTMEDPLTGQLIPAVFVMSKPHCIVVNTIGHRFCNEARPYGDYNQDADSRMPSWLILDTTYLRKYTIGSLLSLPGQVEMAMNGGYLRQSYSLPGLAKQLEIQPEVLARTIDEWNVSCEKGKDIHFGKGEDEYQRFIGDDSMEPNPNMGPIVASPFYAIQIFPGDAGTKGGLLTDEKGRVAHESGGVIDGLYASGNITASPFGKPSIGAGVTIGPAMTFAYIAMLDLSKKIQR
ncbi:hypothetical protein THAR02_09854 [Trichoderma harzianum]|uniref:FAD-dependent oxidoreductase 2 FAD-binding domain-containing protein n=1 Tax=Trichoderma harzianum TaxID=5544 RepID=A0A0F9XBQ4_TRIHA|nr:hypothetical protein THAR02_09854 [Trichoderma harzianum]